MSAASGAAYALGMLIGGHLVARALWLPYAASAMLLFCLAPLLWSRSVETLPKDQRATFGWQLPAVSFLRLFRSGGTLRGLSSVHALQTLSMSMGDTWQVRTSRPQSFGAQFGAQSGAILAPTLSRRRSSGLCARAARLGLGRVRPLRLALWVWRHGGRAADAAVGAPLRHARAHGGRHGVRRSYRPDARAIIGAAGTCSPPILLGSHDRPPLIRRFLRVRRGSRSRPTFWDGRRGWLWRRA